MGSLVVFPFKTERADVFLRNIEIAGSAEMVDEVLCVGYEEEETYEAVEAGAEAIEEAYGARVTLQLQDRIGTRRPGKGDGMNSGLRHFLETGHDRLHFYDADITSFDQSWITKAELAADLGYDIVRHSFPRAATDAMITWMIARPGFAMLFPHSELPWIEQPLGGELLLTRRAAEVLGKHPRVQNQSDWGIDALLTFCGVQTGLSLFEVYLPQGKSHKLYGQLTDIQQMVVEVFAAIQSLKDEPLNGAIVHHVEPPDVVPEAITERIGYDVEGTMQLLPELWTERQEELLAMFPVPIRDGMLAARSRTTYSFMDETSWYDVYQILLEEYVDGDKDWEELLFHMWTVRVLAYTHKVALRGYEYALRYMRGMVYRYLYRSATGRILFDGL